MKTTEVSTKTKWIIDPAHTEIGFKVKHLMFATVRGNFKEFDACIYTNKEDFVHAAIDFWLNPASVTTGDEKRNVHLKSAPFFDVDRFKVISFSANICKHTGRKGSYELQGNLIIKGIERQIKLHVEFGGIVKDLGGNTKALFSINGAINRSDWGLTWNAALENGGFLISEEVWIICEVQLIKQV